MNGRAESWSMNGQDPHGQLPPEFRRLLEQDSTSAQHSLRVAGYALEVAIERSHTDSDLETIYFGALLHDVGKLKVPRSLLTKNGPLTPAERSVVDEHAYMGEQMLRARYGEAIAGIARDHHLAHHGADVDPLTHIVAVCDVFDALRSPRPYKEGMSIADAIGILEEQYAGDERIGILNTLVDVLDRRSAEAFRDHESAKRGLERTLSYDT